LLFFFEKLPSFFFLPFLAIYHTPPDEKAGTSRAIGDRSEEPADKLQAVGLGPFPALHSWRAATLTLFRELERIFFSVEIESDTNGTLESSLAVEPCTVQ
jgi:hypothetical protein